VYYLLQKGCQFEQGGVAHIVEPTLDENAVVRLEREVLSDIIHDDGFVERTTNPAQILDKGDTCRRTMLPVESEGDATLLVDLIEDPVGVILHRSCEDYHFVDLAHLFEEFVAARPHSEATLASSFIIMDECLVQIKHQGVPVLLRRLQIRRLDSLQLLVATNSCASHSVQGQLLCCHF